MRASLSTMRYLASKYGAGTDNDLLEIGVDELVKLATNRLGGLESWEDYGKRFEGVVVAKVMSCIDHNDSDHLHICKLDDGGIANDVDRDEAGYVQVVCGAPNVREGLTVAWLPPGTTVPKSLDENEPFVLGKREIRGVISNGMIASPSELGLFEDHTGILEINESEVGVELTKPGTEFKKLYGLDDVLLDFENKMFTHRPDCFGQIGLARELAGIQHLKYCSPDWYLTKVHHEQKSDKKISSKNEVPEMVPRFVLQIVDNLTIKPSPTWLKAYLSRVGIKSINNIVDWSNYYMHLTAQPTHAFDYDKVKALSNGEVMIYPRKAKKGEKIKLLNGKEIVLSEEDLVIANDSQPIALAGVMGGAETEVDENTKTIVVECATFDMYTVRRMSMRHGLFTDAVTRYTKGQSSLQNDRVLAKMVSDICEYDRGVAGMVYDSAPDSAECSSVRVSAEFINSRLGTELSAKEIVSILANVEIKVSEDGGELVIQPPFWRTDLELKEDIVEEVGRLYGFDRLALKLPMRTTKPAPKNQLNDYKTNIRRTLSSAGANEVLSYSFVHGDILKKVGIAEPEKWCYHIRNAISPDLQYYRPSLIPSLLSKVQSNLRSDMVRTDDNEFALFEIGKAHIKGHESTEPDSIDPRPEKIELPDEMERLALVFAADEKTAGRKYEGSAFYMARKYLEILVGDSIKLEKLDTNEYPITAPYEQTRSASVAVSGQILGVVGEFRPQVKRLFKLPEYCAGVELDMGLLMKLRQQPGYLPVAIFPKVQQDITLAVDENNNYSVVDGHMRDSLESLASEHGYVWRMEIRDIYRSKGSGRINYTFRIWLWHPSKTLKTEEANNITDKLADRAHQELDAVRS